MIPMSEPHLEHHNELEGGFAQFTPLPEEYPYTVETCECGGATPDLDNPCKKCNGYGTYQVYKRPKGQWLMDEDFGEVTELGLKPNW